jgi:hypothetical protein
MNANPFPRQRRKFSRINLDIGARLNFTTGDYECIIKDASLGGMLVAGPFMLVLDKYCPVNIELRSRTVNLNFAASARVVRADENGMAIEFTSMGFDSYVSLQTLLLYNAEDPLAVGVEFPDDPPFGRRRDA